MSQKSARRSTPFWALRISYRTNWAGAARDRLVHVDRAAKHLLSLIENILDLSKIEAGRLELEECDFELGQLFADVVSLIGPAARAKGLRLNMDMNHMPARLSGDVTRLRQALLNYMHNALKFTESGFITLRATLMDEQDGTIFARFEVEILGVGIDRTSCHGCSALSNRPTPPRRANMAEPGSDSRSPANSRKRWAARRERKVRPGSAALSGLPRV